MSDVFNDNVDSLSQIDIDSSSFPFSDSAENVQTDLSSTESQGIVDSETITSDISESPQNDNNSEQSEADSSSEQASSPTYTIVVSDSESVQRLEDILAKIDTVIQYQEDSSKQYLEVMSFQNSILLAQLITMTLITGFLLARIVWRKI